MMQPLHRVAAFCIVLAMVPAPAVHCFVHETNTLAFQKLGIQSRQLPFRAQPTKLPMVAAQDGGDDVQPIHFDDFSRDILIGEEYAAPMEGGWQEQLDRRIKMIQRRESMAERESKLREMIRRERLTGDKTRTFVAPPTREVDRTVASPSPPDESGAAGGP